MNNMRRGFTMIELIFVIVIIGILAAVAIPKLAATRDDAENTKLRSNVTICLTDYVGSYTATGVMTNTETSSACVAVLAATDGLISETGNDVNVSLKLQDGTTVYSQSATYKGSGIAL